MRVVLESGMVPHIRTHGYVAQEGLNLWVAYYKIDPGDVDGPQRYLGYKRLDEYPSREAGIDALWAFAEAREKTRELSRG